MNSVLNAILAVVSCGLVEHSLDLEEIFQIKPPEDILGNFNKVALSNT